MDKCNFRFFYFIVSLLVSVTANGQFFFSQDCAGALSLCNGRFVFPYSFDGSGTVDELALLPTCLPRSEGNSAWYRLEIDAPGYVAFSIEPLGFGDDYDFAMFDITGLSCGNILDTTAMLVRCSYANSGGIATGLNSIDTLTSAGENDGPFLQWLPVDSGDVLVLLITSSSPFGCGYALDLTTSTASILSREPLQIADKVMAICEDYLYAELYFNQPIDTNSISSDFSEFSLVDNMGGNITITNVLFDSIPNKLAIVANKPNYAIDSVLMGYQWGIDSNTIRSACNNQYLTVGVDSFNYLFNNIGAGGFTATNIGRRYSMQANTVNVPFVSWYVNGNLVIRQQASLPFVSNFTVGQDYRVCMVAELGCNYDSTCQTFTFTGIDNLKTGDPILSYPNPVNDFLVIETPFLIDKIELVDLHGKVCFSMLPNAANSTIPTSELPSGLYIARLGAAGRYYIRKVIVSHW